MGGCVCMGNILLIAKEVQDESEAQTRHHLNLLLLQERTWRVSRRGRYKLAMLLGVA